MFFVRATCAADHRSASLLVGSVATNGFLGCRAHVGSVASQDPAITSPAAPSRGSTPLRDSKTASGATRYLAIIFLATALTACG